MGHLSRRGCAPIAALLVAGLALSTSPARGQSWPAGESRRTVRVGALERTYTVVVPTRRPPNAPLIVMLHGGGQSGADLQRQSGFDRVALREGAVVAYPDAVGGRWVNGTKATEAPSGVDDLTFLDTMIAQISAAIDIDPGRVSVAGASNGGLMAYWLGCSRPTRFVAIAAVIATPGRDQLSNCPVSSLPSTLVILGTDDEFMPFEGGLGRASAAGSPGVLSSAETADFFVRALSCRGAVSEEPPPVDSADPTSVSVTRYTDCRNSARYEHYVVRGMGHRWPGGIGGRTVVPAFGRGSVQLDGSETIWRFFASASNSAEHGAPPTTRAPLPRRVATDVAYRSIPGVDPRLLSLDVYAPPSPTGGPSPVMVMVHGGGFITGDKAGDPRLDRPPLLYPEMEYYTGRGWVFVSVNYRLTDPRLGRVPGQVSHPDHIEDVASAIGFLRRNVHTYGGDPTRIVLMGHSAGAGLVALAATDDRRLTRHGVRVRDLLGVVALDGVFDIAAQMPVAAPFMTTVFGTDRASWRDASPIAHVAPRKGIPPMLVVFDPDSVKGTSERQATSFVRALVAAGVPASAYPARGKSHAEIGSDIGVPGDPLSDRVDAFLSGLPRPRPQR